MTNGYPTPVSDETPDNEFWSAELLDALTVVPPIVSGSWRSNPHMHDYRFEWLSELLVERATWHANAPVKFMGETQVAGPGFIWFRFWLPGDDLVVEKFFGADRQHAATHIPVCTPLRRMEQGYQAHNMILALLLRPAGRLDVLDEERFDQAVRDGLLPPAYVEHAERQFRRLTAGIAKRQLPPALVRNFELHLD
jgi:hypothetical protein